MRRPVHGVLGARMSTAYAKLGVPAEYGLSWLLPRLVGVERALDLLLSARRVEVEEAERMGLISRVCDAGDVLSEAHAYARLLATSCSPIAMATIRRQVWGDLSRTYPEANEVWLAAMRRLNAPENADFAEGVAAFMERRSPQFPPYLRSSSRPCHRLRRSDHGPPAPRGRGLPLDGAGVPRRTSSRWLAKYRGHAPRGGSGLTDQWRKTRCEHGLLGLSWPTEYGGGGRTKVEQVVLVEADQW